MGAGVPELFGETPGQFPYRLTHEDRFQYHVKVQPVAGQLEFSIRTVDTRLAAMASLRAFQGYPKRIGPAAETDREDNIRKAKLRAKSQVKLLSMELGVDRLLTFTIRKVGDVLMEYNEVLKAWDYFRRLALRYDKNFAYVCAPEVQKNGQLHIHAGVRGFINVRIYTRMWQSALNRVLKRGQNLVAGADSPGTCNVTKALRGAVLTKAKNIARYIAKYIGKALETGFNRKSYFHTVGIKITPAQRRWLEAQTRDDAIFEVLRAYDLLDDLGVPLAAIWCRDGCSAWFSVDARLSQPPPF
jgi:hypothetical protein